MQPETGAGFEHCGNGRMVDGFGSAECEPQRRKIERTVGGRPQVTRQKGVREVRPCGHRPTVPGDQRRPQPRRSEKVRGCRANGLRADLHGQNEKSDHAHVVIQRQPTHQHVGLRIEFRCTHHRRRIPVEIPMRDRNRLRHSRRARRELQERDIVLAAIDRFQRRSFSQRLRGHDGRALRFEERHRACEDVAYHGDFRADHIEHGERVFRPGAEVDSWTGLVEHRHRRTAHPHRLNHRRNAGGVADQHTHRVAGIHAGRRERARHAACDPMDLFPRASDGMVGFPRYQAFAGGRRRGEDFFRKTAHDSIDPDLPVSRGRRRR